MDNPKISGLSLISLSDIGLEDLRTIFDENFYCFLLNNFPKFNLIKSNVNFYSFILFENSGILGINWGTCRHNANFLLIRIILQYI